MKDKEIHIKEPIIYTSSRGKEFFIYGWTSKKYPNKPKLEIEIRGRVLIDGRMSIEKLIGFSDSWDIFHQERITTYNKGYNLERIIKKYTKKMKKELSKYVK